MLSLQSLFANDAILIVPDSNEFMNLAVQDPAYDFNTMDLQSLFDGETFYRNAPILSDGMKVYDFFTGVARVIDAKFPTEKQKICNLGGSKN